MRRRRFHGRIVKAWLRGLRERGRLERENERLNREVSVLRHETAVLRGALHVARRFDTPDPDGGL